ncbi:MAG: hypothetical protein K9G63_07895 [Melioribacteraceae bacterium]|nr:hypothetical protein [Melioribacteraceae bacterium]
MFNKISLLFVLLFIAVINLFAANNDSLKIESKNEVSQIEVGSPFVGIEIHNSFPMINRISFYYPVANSIDVSEDYWKRENYRIMSMGLKIGDEPYFVFEEAPWKVIQTPYDVEFSKDTLDSGIKIKYEFCMNEPAMSAEFVIENKSGSPKNYEICLRYAAVIRTSHTYSLIDSGTAKTSTDSRLINLFYDYDDTGNAQIFFYNVGEKPFNSTVKFQSEGEGDCYSKPGVTFVYKKELQPGETLDIVQLIGSEKIGESEAVIAGLEKNYKKEIAEYENYIIENSSSGQVIKTGNAVFDFTTEWALAVLKTNAHYIDTDIVPMPAPAEYNFYFTHDALLTDLAAVNFDLERVKNDLTFILKHADENNVIPHAYYWKDGKYATEYAGTENWNHFWFTILAARYLRHSGDYEFARILLPYVQQSINTALKNKENNLMYSFRPDWWDIGNNYGPRAYMTILAIKALREFNYFSAELNTDNAEILQYSSIADSLHKNLINELWNNDLNYLTSYFEDGTEDKHIYMGSMLASHFELLDDMRNAQLIETASNYLLDENLGVYTLFPMDLHELVDYMGFAGNEAGEPFYYANGGIWPHGNAWYALGLISNQRYDEAYEFIRKIMTLDGVINSPNGQPAMYEYRISDKSNPDLYGKIDKPQFLWAGGWYLYSLYNLYGIRENDWNISIHPYLPNDSDTVNLHLTIAGKLVPISISGKGEFVSSFLIDGQNSPSYIIPDDDEAPTEISIELGNLNDPMITKANTKIINPEYSSSSKTLSFYTKSFSSNKVLVEIISPMRSKNILIDGEKLISIEEHDLKEGVQKIIFEFLQKEEGNKIDISFN